MLECEFTLTTDLDVSVPKIKVQNEQKRIPSVLGYGKRVPVHKRFVDRYSSRWLSAPLELHVKSTFTGIVFFL
jgi:hypothetical protein